ncbi:MAG: Jag N-terminal domain-containing protein [Syntrophales bacterium]|nr:Jag N-terminal domain-containing protein [Syntrophales bacterium]HOG08296.1 RNA-binding cell elongation regulator Jag/EloR [Syntrophales bacterium]HOS77737.1 RNA-binding cell elongation regulator Jag/EloR [Syntrophales bacterium]HPB70295.1 RNA-binding cell elongation regulator Jag/EloR [Syntrophales bacterium]HQN25542.1 RNA-binding cell elongation regulator Jag/EloR [Syntrophales bacterium]
MKSIEIEGKSIDEAIVKACEAFAVPREKLQIEILSEGAAGFLGIGARKARIRAGLMNLSLDLDDREDATAEPVPDVPAPERTSLFKQEPGPAPQPVGEAPPPPGRRREPAARPAPETPPRPKRSPAPPHRGAEKPPVESRAAAATPDPEPAGDVALQAKAVLEGILERMDLKYPVSVQETEDAIRLDIQGDGGGLLIGKRGQNLDALQYIVNKAAYKAGNGKKVIIVDTETYRQRREESLVSLAERLGEKVRKTQKPLTVSHMNAHDRRIIHLALQNDTQLATKSRGEGEYRKIIIMPARSRPPRDQADPHEHS